MEISFQKGGPETGPRDARAHGGAISQVDDRDGACPGGSHRPVMRETLRRRAGPRSRRRLRPGAARPRWPGRPRRWERLRRPPDRSDVHTSELPYLLHNPHGIVVLTTNHKNINT